jgi:hypothetical protein
VSAVTAPRRKVRPDAEPRRHLRVVREPTPRHTLAYVLAIVLILAGAVFGAVALNALAAGASVESRELDQRVAEAERHYAQLVADVAALEDPARIREMAVEQGLVAAGPGRQVVLERNLEADGAVTPVDVLQGTADPLKPLLSVEH